jgi:hypothetical protein
MANAQLEDFPVPEMRRVSLEDVCLQVTRLVVNLFTRASVYSWGWATQRNSWRHALSRPRGSK